jgi:acetyl esterase/lipase
MVSRKGATVMGLLLFMVCLGWSAVTVTLARAAHGPLLPTWTWGYEVINRAQKRFHAVVARCTPAIERRAWAALRSPPEALKQTHALRRRIDGVDVVSLEPHEQDGSGRVLLYIHGGAFMYGGERSHGELVAAMALAAGARAVLPLYRLAPEHPFPAALDDVLGVYRGLLAEGVPAAHIVLAGDSAGGNLALAAALRLRDPGNELPAALMLISPWVDLADRGGSMVRNEPFEWGSRWMFDRWVGAYTGGAELQPLASPGRMDLHGLCPCLVLVGTAEMLHDQVTAFAERARAAGVDLVLSEAPERTHMWLALGSMVAGFEATMATIGAFVRERTTPQASPGRAAPR